MAKYKLPMRIRQQVWINSFGEAFRRKCSTPWCSNSITVYDFHCGHRTAECKGGTSDIQNLVPICAPCNLSMGSKSFDSWAKSSPTCVPEVPVSKGCC